LYLSEEKKLVWSISGNEELHGMSSSLHFAHLRKVKTRTNSAALMEKMRNICIVVQIRKSKQKRKLGETSKICK